MVVRCDIQFGKKAVTDTDLVETLQWMLQSDQEQEKNLGLFDGICKSCFGKLEKSSKALDETDEKLTGPLDAIFRQYL